jgi:hypothetical protein
VFLTIDGPLYKVRHAQHHLETLKDELTSWIDGRPYLVSIEHESRPEAHTWTFTMNEVLDAPPRIALVFGDYVHNLRSALDQLVWAMSVNNNRGKDPSNANLIGFPVADKPERFYDAPVLRNLTWEQATVLESFQPYHGGDANKALGDLNVLWNDDKHRLIHPVITRMKRMPIFEMTDVGDVIDEWYEAKRPLKPDTKIACVTAVPSGPNPDVQVKNIPVSVAFGKRRRITDDEVPSLRNVTGDILLACKRFFEPS